MQTRSFRSSIKKDYDEESEDINLEETSDQEENDPIEIQVKKDETEEDKEINSDQEEEDAKEENNDQPIEAIIYCRISSMAQKEGVSLAVQEQVCLDYCKKNGWQVIHIVREITSATDTKNQKLLLSIVESYGEDKIPRKLIVYNISRFSRNVSKGLELARKMRENNLHLVSSMEMIDVSTASGEFNLTNLLNAAEFESKLIGKRVKDALEKLKKEGHQLGRAPFGSKVEKIEDKRKFVVEEKEQGIIQFIVLCRTVGTTVDTLNESLQKICSEEEYAPIKLSRKKLLVEELSYDNISELLNSYRIQNRAKPWTKNAVSRIYKRYQKAITDTLKQ